MAIDLACGTEGICASAAVQPSILPGKDTRGAAPAGEASPVVAAGVPAPVGTGVGCWGALRRLTGPQRALVARHIGLVGLHLSRHVPGIRKPRRRRERDDLFQEGCLALIRAAMAYDPARHGAFFSTYAMPRIRGAVHRALREYFLTIHVPMNAQQPARRAAGRRVLTDGIIDLAYEVAQRLPSGVREAGETIQHGIHHRYERAIRLAAAELRARARGRRRPGPIIDRVVSERLLIGEPRCRTSLRRIARECGVSNSRVQTCEKRLLTLARRHFAEDPQTRLLIRLAGEEPLGFSSRIDAEQRRRLRQADVGAFRERFAALPRRAQADVLYGMVERMTPAVGEVAANLYRLTGEQGVFVAGRAA